MALNRALIGLQCVKSKHVLQLCPIQITTTRSIQLTSKRSMFGWTKFGPEVKNDKNLFKIYHGFKGVKMALLLGCAYFGYTRYQKRQQYREMTKPVETDGNYKTGRF